MKGPQDLKSKRRQWENLSLLNPNGVGKMRTLSIKVEADSYSAFLQTIMASFFIGVCAQIKIPLYFTPVPLTVQTIGVLLVGAKLGSRKGAFAAFLYLVQGALGWPVWAGGNAGFHHLLGPTGGYLLAYPLEACLIGWFLERQTRQRFYTAAAILLPCTLQMAIGTLWLIFFVGAKNILSLGFYPFIAWEITKAALITVYFRLHTQNKEKTYGF